MNLTDWLNALAASYPHFKLTPLQVAEYREAFRSWPLASDEWQQLKTLARERYSKFFPSIGELEELMHEVKRNKAAGRNGKAVWETFIGPDGLVYARRPS
jgi:hypothetical protein